MIYIKTIKPPEKDYLILHSVGMWRFHTGQAGEHARMGYRVAQFNLQRLINPEPLVFADQEPSSTLTLISKESPGTFSFSIQSFEEFFTWHGYSENYRAIGLHSEREEYLFKASYQGSYLASIGSIKQIVDRSLGCMIDCHKNTRVDIDAGNAAFGFGISRRRISQALNRYYGKMVPAGFEFEPQVSMSAPYMQTLHNMLTFFREDALKHQALGRSSLALPLFEESVSMFVVQNFRHSMSALGEIPEKMLVPRQVRHAMEFVVANAARPISLADMAEVAGVSVRALQVNFQRFINRSPIEFLREERLRRCHLDIVAAAPGEMVAAIASRWGFVHPGRFAAVYKRAYGRSPSEDLGNDKRLLRVAVRPDRIRGNPQS